MKRSIQHAASISICLGPTSFHYHTIPTHPESQRRLDFKLEGTQRPYAPLDWFSKHFHGSCVESPPIALRFDREFNFTQDETLMNSLSRLMNSLSRLMNSLSTLMNSLSRLQTVTSVKVADRTGSPCRLLSWLSKQPTQRFPTLVEMEIGQSNLSVENIRDFAQRRYGGKEKPTELRNLVVIGNDWTDFSVTKQVSNALPTTICSFQRTSWKHIPCRVNEELERDDEGDEGDDADSES
ncbi:hypothetical protein FRB90_003541, partial [Tulasnella sp. 427]